MGRFTGGRPGQAAAGSTGRSLAGGIRPRRWTFAAGTASATVRAKPFFPWLRTRSRPRCQVADGRFDGGVGAPRPAERLAAFPDTVRLRQPYFPWHGVGSGIPSRVSRSEGLRNPGRS